MIFVNNPNSFVINTKDNKPKMEKVNINRVGCTAIIRDDIETKEVYLEVMSETKLVYANLTVNEAKELINEIQLQLIKIGESVERSLIKLDESI
jgi:hypothetical protein